MIDYIKIDFDKIPLEGSAKDQIHDTLLYILHQYVNGVEIESVNEKINYQSVILLLTATGYAHDDVNGTISQIGNDIRTFLRYLVEDGKSKNEIRQNLSTKNIVESLYTMYMGIQGFWLTFANDDVDLIFEKNFDMTWQTLEFQ